MNEPKTCFKKVDYDLSGLLHYIDIGDMGLPDIQRPFVWSKAKVRDLFDSMYRGFPVGYLLFWANGAVDGARQIGTDGKQKAPNLLIVDGQQRLTSLYSVLRGKQVLDSDYKSNGSPGILPSGSVRYSRSWTPTREGSRCEKSVQA